MDAPGVFWVKHGFMAVAVPLFNSNVDVELVLRNGHSCKEKWNAGFALCYCNMGLHIKRDNIRFILYFYELDNI